MTGSYIGRIEDFAPPAPHKCEPPTRMNFASGERVPSATRGQLWRCECGKAFECIIEQDQRDHDQWTAWVRFPKADAIHAPVASESDQ